MHRRHQHTNVPTEIVRTIVVIAEAGSFSKAGERLGLSQPAISAQVKRLQYIVGGPIFEKTTGGVSFTAKGKMILAHARKLLDANDQILNIGGALSDAQPVRLGIPVLYVEHFLRDWHAGDDLASQMTFFCDHSGELTKTFADGYLDVACLVNVNDDIGDPVFGWEEDLAWVRSRHFVLRHGSPLPVVGCPGGWQDEVMISAVEKGGVAYRIAFTSNDLHARTAAVANSIGLMLFPARYVSDPLVIANEYYLPKLPRVRTGIFVRPRAEPDRISQIVDRLKSLAPSGERTGAAIRQERRTARAKAHQFL